MSINKVVISGNLTRDPELRQTANGFPTLSISVAVNERVKNGEKWEDRPNFVDCVMFGERGAKVGRYLSKGSKVCVEGKLRWSQWERDGQKRSKIEVVVDELEFMTAHEQQAPQQAPQAQPMPQQTQAPWYN